MPDNRNNPIREPDRITRLTSSRHASLSAIAAVLCLGAPAAAHATISIGDEGITVHAPEAVEPEPVTVEEEGQGGGLTEIVVTATKRETNLQKKPRSRFR